MIVLQPNWIQLQKIIALLASIELHFYEISGFVEFLIVSYWTSLEGENTHDTKISYIKYVF